MRPSPLRSGAFTLSHLWDATTTPLYTIPFQQQQQQQEIVSGGMAQKEHHNRSSSTSSTYIGTRLSSYMLSPVIEERHCLWQWRTVMWRETLHAVPFLLHCAPSVPLRRPFLHQSAAACIYTCAGWNRKANCHTTATTTTLHTGEKPRQLGNQRRGRYTEMALPTPIGALPVIDDTIAVWVDELFHFLEEGEKRIKGATTHSSHVYTDVFEHNDGELELPTPPDPIPKAVDFTNTSSSGGHDGKNSRSCTNPMDDSPVPYLHCSFPATHRNVIGCGLAEVVVAIDRYAAMVARCDITYAKACWAVLVDSKADVQPYLRCNALAIERDLIAGAKAHEAINTAMGDPVRRPLLKLKEYPSLAGW